MSVGLIPLKWPLSRYYMILVWLKAVELLCIFNSLIMTQPRYQHMLLYRCWTQFRTAGACHVKTIQDAQEFPWFEKQASSYLCRNIFKCCLAHWLQFHWLFAEIISGNARIADIFTNQQFLLPARNPWMCTCLALIPWNGTLLCTQHTSYVAG